MTEKDERSIIRTAKKHEPIPHEKLPEDIYSLLKRSNVNFDTLQITPEQLNRLKEGYKRMLTGPHATMFMLCRGEGVRGNGTTATIDPCPNHYICPLREINAIPVGQECPIEKDIARHLAQTYAEDISMVLGSAPDKLSIIIRNSIMDLVCDDLIEMRAQGILAREGYFQERPIVLQNGTHVGEEIYIHMAFELKQRVQKHKDQIMRSLAVSEEYKSKYRKGKTDDPNAAVSKIVSAIGDAIKTNSAKSQVINDVDFTVLKDNNDE